MIKNMEAIKLAYKINDEVDVNSLKQFLIKANYTQVELHIYTNRIFTDVEKMLLEEYDYEFDNILIISNNTEVVDYLKGNTKLVACLNSDLMKNRDEIIEDLFAATRNL